MLARLTALPPSSVVVSGHEVGYIGPADIIVGVDRPRRAGQPGGPVTVASSTPYSFIRVRADPAADPLTSPAIVTPPPQEETLGP